MSLEDSEYYLTSVRKKTAPKLTGSSVKKGLDLAVQRRFKRYYRHEMVPSSSGMLLMLVSFRYSKGYRSQIYRIRLLSVYRLIFPWHKDINDVEPE